MELARLDRWLVVQLFRRDCPAPEQLGEYQLGWLPADEARAISEHVKGCPRCARELEQLAQFMAAEPVEEMSRAGQPSVGERVRVLLARLVTEAERSSRSFLPSLAPAGVGLRGQEAAPRVYQAGDIEIVVETRPIPERPNEVTLSGLVLGLHGREPMVHVWSQARRVAVARIDDLGSFEVPRLPSGQYELIVTSSAVEVHIPPLQA